MRKNLKAKAYIYPLPVLIVGTYDENGTPNAMNAAWGGIYDTNQVMILSQVAAQAILLFKSFKKFIDIVKHQRQIHLFILNLKRNIGGGNNLSTFMSMGSRKSL